MSIENVDIEAEDRITAADMDSRIREAKDKKIREELVDIVRTLGNVTGRIAALESRFSK